MPVGESETRDEWDYLCHHLLINLKNRQNSDISKTTFYKLVCVTDRVLRNNFDTDIELPCYWYRYGEIVDSNQLNSAVVNIESAEWDGERAEPTRAVAEHEFDVSDHLREVISRATRQVAGMFGERNSEAIRSYQYHQYAPTEFIRIFDQYRDSISEPNRTLDEFYTQEDNQSRKDRISILLDDMVSAYPKDQYDEMYDVFLRWEDTSQLLLEENRFSDLRSLSESFWATFCKVEARLHHKRGISAEKTAQWIRSRDDIKNEFEKELSSQREELLAKRDTSPLFNAVVGSE